MDTQDVFKIILTNLNSMMLSMIKIGEKRFIMKWKACARTILELTSTALNSHGDFLDMIFSV